jgi:hypothetical protein
MRCLVTWFTSLFLTKSYRLEVSWLLNHLQVDKDPKRVNFRIFAWFSVGRICGLVYGSCSPAPPPTQRTSSAVVVADVAISSASGAAKTGTGTTCEAIAVCIPTLRYRFTYRYWHPLRPDPTRFLVLFSTMAPGYNPHTPPTATHSWAPALCLIRSTFCSANHFFHLLRTHRCCPKR